MYLEFFGLSEPPFRITPHTDFFFNGANRGATLDALLYAITHDEGIVKVSGEVGSGKTMLCRVLMERLPDNVTSIYLANPSLSREDILYAIADELRIVVTDRTRLSALLKALHDHLIREFSSGRQVVVLIDEAHAMPIESLEEIRLLSNLESNRSKLLQLVLFGQPELNDTLARADMRQLKERITHNFVLEPLVRDDIANYVDFRLRAAGYRGPDLFTPQAIRQMARVSQGLTRRVNILADKALLAAFSAGSHQVGSREMRRAISDCDFSNATYSTKKHLSVKVGIAIAIAIVLVLAIVFGMSPVGNGIEAGGDRKSPTESPPPKSPAQTKLPAEMSEKPNGIGVAVPAGGKTDEDTQSVDERIPLDQSTRGQELHPPIPNEHEGTRAAIVAKTPLTKAVGVRTKAALDQGQDWMKAAPDDRWFIQLYTGPGTDTAQVEDAIMRIEQSGMPIDEIRAYRSELSGSTRFGVIYGDFESRNAAASAMHRLPKALTSLKPYPRQVVRLRQ